MQHLSENFIFEKGADADVVLILFTGFGQRPASLLFDFIQTSGLYQYSRILVRDPSQRMCLHGIGGQLDSLEKVIDALQQTVQHLNAKRIITIGSSGGSHPAILAAHLLKADYCHAFSPFPYANLERVILRMDLQVIKSFWRTVIKLNFRPTRSRKYYDLRKVLANSNNHTRYFFHVCKHYFWDYRRAKYLADLPNATLFGYDCEHHAVVRHLAKQKCLESIFKVENQDDLFRMEIFRNAMETEWKWRTWQATWRVSALHRDVLLGCGRRYGPARSRRSLADHGAQV
jgi:hypothetical protein